MKIEATRITSENDNTVQSITDNKMLIELGRRLMEEISEWGEISAKITLCPLIHIEKHNPDGEVYYEWWRTILLTPVP